MQVDVSANEHGQLDFSQHKQVLWRNMTETPVATPPNKNILAKKERAKDRAPVVWAIPKGVGIEQAEDKSEAPWGVNRVITAQIAQIHHGSYTVRVLTSEPDYTPVGGKNTGNPPVEKRRVYLASIPTAQQVKVFEQISQAPPRPNVYVFDVPDPNKINVAVVDIGEDGEGWKHSYLGELRNQDVLGKGRGVALEQAGHEDGNNHEERKIFSDGVSWNSVVDALTGKDIPHDEKEIFRDSVSAINGASDAIEALRSSRAIRMYSSTPGSQPVSHDFFE